MIDHINKPRWKNYLLHFRFLQTFSLSRNIGIYKLHRIIFAADCYVASCTKYWRVWQWQAQGNPCLWVTHKIIIRNNWIQPLYNLLTSLICLFTNYHIMHTNPDPRNIWGGSFFVNMYSRCSVFLYNSFIFIIWVAIILHLFDLKVSVANLKIFGKVSNFPFPGNWFSTWQQMLSFLVKNRQPNTISMRRINVGIVIGQK